MKEWKCAHLSSAPPLPYEERRNGDVIVRHYKTDRTAEGEAFVKLELKQFRILGGSLPFKIYGVTNRNRRILLLASNDSDTLIRIMDGFNNSHLKRWESEA